MITLSAARARGIALPTDDVAAQDVIDGEEAWLAARIGPLTGARTETFYVGSGRSEAKLTLRRPTDAVTVSDGGTAVAGASLRLGATSSAATTIGTTIRRIYSDGTNALWAGPNVAVTYEPTDEDAVRRVLYALLALAADLPGGFESERLGDYSRSRGNAGATLEASRAVLASSLLAPRDPLTAVHLVTGYHHDWVL